MKLSQFKKSELVKKLVFVNGEMKTIEVNTNLNGEIEFYDIDSDKAKLIQKEVLDKGIEDGDERFIYSLIPYLTNVENDITLEEFKVMFKNPSIEFTELVNGIIMSLKLMFEKVEALVNLRNSSEELMSDMDVAIFAKDMEILNEEEEKNKKKESELEGLYNELNTAVEKDRKKEIIRRITEIENS